MRKKYGFTLFITSSKRVKRNEGVNFTIPFCTRACLFHLFFSIPCLFHVDSFSFSSVSLFFLWLCCFVFCIVRWDADIEGYMG